MSYDLEGHTWEAEDELCDTTNHRLSEVIRFASCTGGRITEILSIKAKDVDLEFTTASCSRNIAWLSHKHRLNKPGLGLVNFERDPSNRRRYIVELTIKGRALINTLEAKLYG